MKRMNRILKKIKIDRFLSILENIENLHESSAKRAIIDAHGNLVRETNADFFIVSIY